MPHPSFIRPNQKLLFILNGGNMSRHWVRGMIAGAQKAKLAGTWIELDQIRQSLSASPVDTINQLNEIVRSQRVGAVINYAGNGVRDVPVSERSPGNPRTFWETRGIPTLNLWADHPQWVADRSALQPEWQPFFRSGLTHHFLKNDAHAYELERVLGWPHCHEVRCAADTDMLTPATDVQPEYDVVAVWGGKPDLPEWTLPFLEQDDPDPAEMNEAAAKHISAQIDAVWLAEAPLALQAALTIVGRKMVELKKLNPRAAIVRHLPLLEENYPRTIWWLMENHALYFKVTGLLYQFRNWQRSFIPAYLAKYFKVAIFGGDWKSLGVAGGDWVNFADMPKALARGKVAINIVSGWDEEGLTAKTFEMAAAGVPIVHNDCVGLSDCYDIGTEIESFVRPKEAREKIQTLLDSPDKRHSMAGAIRARTVRDHTWAPRVESMLRLAGLPLDAFRA